MDPNPKLPELAEEVAKQVREQLQSEAFIEALVAAVLQKMQGPQAAKTETVAPAPKAEPKKEEAPKVEEEIPEHHLAIIFAAIASVFGKPMNIRDIAIVAPGASNPWGTQGRISIQRSHLRFSQDW